LQVTSRDKEIHEREEELRKVQDQHSKDKKNMEEVEAQLKKTMEERALLTEQIFREKEMAAEADDVSSAPFCMNVFFSSSTYLLDIKLVFLL
jgi:Tfp pilus assembly protein PilO